MRLELALREVARRLLDGPLLLGKLEIHIISAADARAMIAAGPAAFNEGRHPESRLRPAPTASRRAVTLPRSPMSARSPAITAADRCGYCCRWRCRIRRRRKPGERGTARARALTASGI